MSCFGEADGRIILNPYSDAVGIPTVLWDITSSIPSNTNTLTSTSVNGLLPGTYTVTITDSDGCTITEDFIITEPNAITASISFVEPLCYGDANGSATISSNGGTGAPATWIYDWSPSFGNTQTVNNLSSGINYVYVTDLNGCTDTFEVIISQPDPVSAVVEPNLFYNEDQLGNPFHICLLYTSDAADE